MFRSLALSSAAGLAWLAPAALDSTPPTSDPQTTDQQAELDTTPEFERKLAELAFALYLGDELDVDAGTYACTEPSSLTVGTTLTCFTLIDDQRVVVAVTELTGSSGIYEFEIVSDQQIGTDETPSTDAGASTTTLPTPVLITTVAPLSRPDVDLLAFGARINHDAAAYVSTLTADDGIVESAAYSWDTESATVAVSSTLAPTSANGLDAAAWVITRDRAMDLWKRESPFRASGTSIHPSLEVTVDGVRFVSDFELCVQIADQTIAMGDWLDAARRT